jgi:hypothetical protein
LKLGTWMFTSLGAGIVPGRLICLNLSRQSSHNYGVSFSGTHNFRMRIDYARQIQTPTAVAGGAELDKLPCNNELAASRRV